jgi:hypothetical protein
MKNGMSFLMMFFIASVLNFSTDGLMIAKVERDNKISLITKNQPCSSVIAVSGAAACGVTVSGLRIRNGSTTINYT